MDYLILANHYHGEEREGKYFGYYADRISFGEYAGVIAKGWESGLFAFLAHPDLIFSDYPVFDKDAEALSKEIFGLAEAYDMPLEFNLSGFKKKPFFRGIGYPCRQFWEIGRDYDIRVVVGLDAHAPKRIDGKLMAEYQEKLVKAGFKVINDSLL